MLKWMVTSRIGRDDGNIGDDIFTISRSPDYGTLETVTSESSGYSSALVSTLNK